jgi:hypothetical protein
MREKELRERATCSACGKKIGHAQVPIFWTLCIERHGIKRDAVMRQQGLTMMLDGNAALASVMGTDEEMTTPLIEPVTVTVCEPCSLERVCIAQLAETK